MQSSSQIVTTNKPTPSFFTGRMPFLPPNQQCQSTEGKTVEMKKALRETQTLRAKNFRPAADPLPGGAGPLKFNQSLSAPTDPVW